MKEDFVTYEIAVKLKEKGFDWTCMAHFNNITYNKPTLNYNVTVDDVRGSNFKSLNKLDSFIDAPTISQVLKWLMEEKDIFIRLEYINQERYGCTIIAQKTGGLIAQWNWDKFQYANKNPLAGDTYEKAANAGIKYVIDNLI